MKKYLVFAGFDDYANGGWKDFVGDFDTITEATALGDHFTFEGYEWSHIVDTEKKRIILEWEKGSGWKTVS